MAHTRTAITSDSVWNLVASQGAWVSIQVVGNEHVDFAIQTGMPTELAGILRVLDAINPDTFGDGDVYVKLRSGGAVSSVAIVTA